MINKHENYDILNLIGYGLSKFDSAFINEFGFSTKTDFYKFCVENKIADTTGVVKNRMDLFDHFFPNKRRGWWQKGDSYIHRKKLIDSLFGNENVQNYANIIKLYMREFFDIKGIEKCDASPIIKTRFKKLQETGLEAELFFMGNYQSIDFFQGGTLEDARLYGDGYDFQITLKDNSFLTEVKGIREEKGKFRLTENEYNKAVEYKNDYIIALVLNLNKIPKISLIEDPIKNLKFQERIIKSKYVKEYHLLKSIC